MTDSPGPNKAKLRFELLRQLSPELRDKARLVEDAIKFAEWRARDGHLSIFYAVVLLSMRDGIMEKLSGTDFEQAAWWQPGAPRADGPAADEARPGLEEELAQRE